MISSMPSGRAPGQLLVEAARQGLAELPEMPANSYLRTTTSIVPELSDIPASARKNPQGLRALLSRSRNATRATLATTLDRELTAAERISPEGEPDV
jgi:hypothetical protein